MSHRLFARVVVASLVASVSAAVVVVAASDTRAFRIRDDCDPKTFNAGPPDGPGSPTPLCNENFDGGTTFAEFIEELTEDGTIGSWRFNPDRVELDRGERTVLESRGGEFHTFTKVANFGGGIVAGLNDLTGSGGTVPECGSLDNLAPPSPANLFVPDGFVVPGPTAGRSDELPRGSSTKWQCCIHPWMRSEIKVR
jgi:hypothetical protein